MVWPLGKSALSSAAFRATALAASSMAAFSRNLPACSSDISRERTSRSSVWSPAHACRRNASRSSGGRSITDCSTSSTCFHRSESIRGPASQFAVEPGPGRPPVTLHSDSRHFEHLCSLFHAEPAKEAHFDNLHFTRIDPRERVHSGVELHQVRVLGAAHDVCIFEGDMLHSASAFQVMTPRMLYQNTPHQLRRNGEKMGAILPLHALIIHQPHVGFIDQGRGLEAVAGALPFHVTASQAAQLVINDGSQPRERALVSVAPGAEELAYVVHSRFTGLCHPLCIAYGVNCTARAVASN